MVLIVASLFGCVFTTILGVTPYIPFCMYHLAKRHMMCVHFERFTVLLCIIVLAWHFSPASRLFLFDCNKIISCPGFLMTLVVICLFGCVSSPILGSFLYVFLYICYMSDGCSCLSFTWWVFMFEFHQLLYHEVHHSSSVKSPSLQWFRVVFFYSDWACEQEQSARTQQILAYCVRPTYPTFLVWVLWESAPHSYYFEDWRCISQQWAVPRRTHAPGVTNKPGLCW